MNLCIEFKVWHPCSTVRNVGKTDFYLFITMVVNIAYSQETIKELYKFVITIIVINNNNNELASVFYLGSLIDTY